MNKFPSKNRKEKDSVLSENMSNSNDIYLQECDSNGIPLLKKIDKYQNLSDDQFIPIKDILDIKNNTYEINKEGIVRNINTGKILSRNIISGGYSVYHFVTNKPNTTKNVRIHRLVAMVFLFNPNPEIYNVVNHIDHNPNNNSLSNLEWVTCTENTNKKNGRSSIVSDDKLTKYISMDDSGNDVFTITRRDNKGYSIGQVMDSIRKNYRYKGFYWRKEKNNNNIYNFLDLINYSGNINDYTWYEHWKYPGIYICSEGFTMKDNKLLGFFRSGYIYVSLNKKSAYPVHRLIMEYILERDLKPEEIVDHINTIRHDNSFNNLRVTNFKGNMNNPLTLEKYYKKCILTDLFGNFISYDNIKNLSKIIYGEIDSNKKIPKKRINLINRSIPIENKYFYVDPNKKEDLLKKMEKIIYIFDKNKSKILKVFTSTKDVSKYYNYSTELVRKYINKEILVDNEIYILRGSKAVDLILSLGYGNALNFKINNHNENNIR